MADEQVVKQSPQSQIPKTDSEKKANLDNMSAMLAHIEAQQLSGAATLTPKQMMLDLSDLRIKHPDKHFRWVNVKAPGKADSRRLDGYIRVPESEGGQELGGELAVFVTTKANYERRVARIEENNKLRLRAHKAEVERQAEAVVRELRDKYGLKVDLNRILVSEE